LKYELVDPMLPTELAAPFTMAVAWAPPLFTVSAVVIATLDPEIPPVTDTVVPAIVLALTVPVVLKLPPMTVPVADTVVAF
jgi:hypothetical protein